MNLVDLFSQSYFFTDHVMRGLQIKLFIRPITFLFSGSTTEIDVALWRLQSELLESENIRKTILVDFCWIAHVEEQVYQNLFFSAFPIDIQLKIYQGIYWNSKIGLWDAFELSYKDSFWSVKTLPELLK